MARSSWSVVATVRTRPRYIERFVEHYSAAGADQIFLFFDDPDHECSATAIERPNCVTVICDEKYWQESYEIRGIAIEDRQQTNVRAAIRRNRSDWLLSVDSDELIFSQRPVADILAAQLDDVFSVTARPIEAVYEIEPDSSNIFDTLWFKRPFENGEDKSIVARIYGDLAPITQRGLFAHTLGKTFFRPRHPIRVYSGHNPQPADQNLRVGIAPAELELLHFQSLTFPDWREKWLRLIEGTFVVGHMSKKRLAQFDLIRRVYRQSGDDGLLNLYRRMNVLDASRLTLARAAGFVVERKL